MANKIILTKEYSNETKSKFYTETENIQMNIDNSALKHIINRLTELYKNPLEATIRELVSNAVDATISAKLKNPKPIQLFLDKYNDLLAIEDFGTGMSYDDLINIYSKYGASTKREDFSAIGSYGLGAKAPLSYTNSFTLITTKNNETVTAIISKTNDFPEIQIISKEVTNESNGTKIQISLNSKDINQAYDIFEDYIRFSDMMSVPVEFIYSDGLQASTITNQEISKMLRVYPLSTKIKINDDLSLNIFTNISTFRDTLFDSKNINLNFVMEGFQYKEYNRDKGIWIQLVPGLVDFNSSRDEILKNNRFLELKNLIKEQIYNIKLVDEKEFLNNYLSLEEMMFYSSLNNYKFLENYKDDKFDFLSYSFKENDNKVFNCFSNGSDRRDLCGVSLNKVVALSVIKKHYNKYIVINSAEESVVKKVKAISREISEYFFLVEDEEVLSVLEGLGFEIISKKEVLQTLKNSKGPNAEESLFKVKKVVFNDGNYTYENKTIKLKDLKNKVLLMSTYDYPNKNNLHSIINKYNPSQKNGFEIYYATNENKSLTQKFKNIKKTGLLSAITLVKGSTTYYSRFPKGFDSFLDENKDFHASTSEELLEKITKEKFLATVFKYIQRDKPYDSKKYESVFSLVFDRDNSINYQTKGLNTYTIEKNLSTFKGEFLPVLTKLSDFAKCIQILKSYNGSISEAIEKDFNDTLTKADKIIEKYYKAIK